MDNRRYAINKYYVLEELNVAVGESAVRALMEKFMVVKVTKQMAGYSYVYQEILGDGFSDYKEALDYIEELLGLPQAKDGE